MRRRMSHATEPPNQIRERGQGEKGTWLVSNPIFFLHISFNVMMVCIVNQIRFKQFSFICSSIYPSAIYTVRRMTFVPRYSHFCRLNGSFGGDIFDIFFSVIFFFVIFFICVWNEEDLSRLGSIGCERGQQVNRPQVHSLNSTSNYYIVRFSAMIEPLVPRQVSLWFYILAITDLAIAEDFIMQLDAQKQE